jgi:hypothetical protein
MVIAQVVKVIHKNCSAIVCNVTLTNLRVVGLNLSHRECHTIVGSQFRVISELAVSPKTYRVVKLYESVAGQLASDSDKPAKARVRGVESNVARACLIVVEFPIGRFLLCGQFTIGQ